MILPMYQRFAHVNRTIRRSAATPRGFTLAELMVVVAIIVVLLALLMPSMRRARYVGRTAVCASQLNQIVVAMTAYATDNWGFYPSWNKFGLRDRTTDLRSTSGFWVHDSVYQQHGVEKQLLPPGSITELIWPNYLPDLNGLFKCPLVTEPDVLDADLNYARRTQFTMFFGVTSVNVIEKPMIRLNQTFTVKGRQFNTLISDAFQGNGYHFYANHVPAGGVWSQPHFTEINHDIYAYRAEYAEGNFAATDGSVIQLGRDNYDPSNNNMAVLNSLNLPLAHER